MSGVVRSLALVLVLVGLWQCGSAMWIKAKAVLAQILLQRSWQLQLLTDTPKPPWPWADWYPVAQLQVPRLQLQQVVVSNAAPRTLAFAPGLVQGQAQAPESGWVIAGHRDTHMAMLAQLQTGDELVLAVAGRERRYQVTQLQVVDSEQSPLWYQPGEDRLTLLTCYPFNAINPGGPLRYLVQALPLAEPRHNSVI